MSINYDTFLRNSAPQDLNQKRIGGIAEQLKLSAGHGGSLSKILLLESNNQLRLSRTHTLSQDGYYVNGVSTVKEAVKAAQQQSYELLIIRVEEPELMNMLIAQFPPEMSVLIITTEDTINKIAEHLGSGVHSFLFQPFSVTRFKERVAQSINKARMVKEGLRCKILTDLEQANRLLAAEDEIDKCFKLVIKLSAAITNADHVSLLIKDKTTGNVKIMARRGDHKLIWKKISEQVMDIGEPLLLDETTQNPPQMHKLIAETGITAVLCIPFVVKGEVIGVLNHIKITEGARFASSDLHFASILGWWISVVLENANLFNSLQKQYVQEEKLLHEVAIAQEKERRRIATDIHDGVAQWLIGASYTLRTCSHLISESKFSDLELTLTEIRKTLQRSVKELRRVIVNLRPLPLDEVGLVGALLQAAEILNTHGIRCDTDINEGLPKLNLAQEKTVYWIVQEALTNVRNHSSASNASIRMLFNDNIFSVEISDNGQGFKSEQVMNSTVELEHVGLLGMRERAEMLGGYLKINSTVGEGTSIGFSFPVSFREAITAGVLR